MSEHRVVNNRVDGHVKESVFQAGSMFVSAPSKTVNNVIRHVRSLNIVAMLYRMLSSLAALAAAGGAVHGERPLGEAATACEALALPSGWTALAAGWINGRVDLVGGVALVSLGASLLALPKLREMGWDLGQTMEWRGPATAVLSFAILVQCGYTWKALPLVVLLSAVGLLVLSGREHRRLRSDHVTVAVGGIVLAVGFAPVYVLALLLGRDAGVAPYPPADM
ncbi:hypothetical protein [Streptomyces caatingaensis]|uniref:Uncharacterized protein n=1 Tax=Streptomyces caatingaensis TaxID=1678637 RepID=A0A0K9XCJ5_9ACTN|nr:hypothetical protein [Streptomyces caatingaensis]KNB50372.1 hypothetical protein AC230_26555 [Streptomyces caatingaensis]